MHPLDQPISLATTFRPRGGGWYWHLYGNVVRSVDSFNHESVWSVYPQSTYGNVPGAFMRFMDLIRQSRISP